jgi:hypothetical protein
MTLKEFLKEAGKVEGGFRLVPSRPRDSKKEWTIRAVKVRDGWNVPACPLVAVYQSVKGEKGENFYPTQYGQRLGLRPDVSARIMDAADGDPRARRLRVRLLKALGLRDS